MIIAGEASGDMHGARLVRAMQALDPGLSFSGIGGNALRAAGVRIKVDNSKIAVVGVSEVISKLKILRNALQVAKEALKRSRPDLLIVIDFPDFNLRVARAAKKLGVPVMYYISPQIWAWRAGRVKKIKRVVDHMVVIFPFEVPLYERCHVPVTFVGHPLLDSVHSKISEGIREASRGNNLVLGLLPGSRNEEIMRLLPTMLQAGELISKEIVGIRFIIAVASSVDRALVESMIQEEGAQSFSLSDKVQDVLNEATLVITASGTVTLEAAIAGTPMIVVYRVSRFSYWLGKRLIRVEHIGLANLVAGRRIVPELLQHQATPENIAQEALRLLQDESRLVEMRRQLHYVAKSLGAPGASRRAAEVAMSLLASS